MIDQNARNDKYWNDKDTSVPKIIVAGSCLRSEFIAAKLSSTPTHPPLPPNSISWSPPTNSVLKLNIDAAVFVDSYSIVWIWYLIFKWLSSSMFEGKAMLWLMNWQNFLRLCSMK